MAKPQANDVRFGHRDGAGQEVRFGTRVLTIPLVGPVARYERPPAAAGAAPDLGALAAAAVAALPAPPRRPALVVPDRTRDARADLVVPALLEALGLAPGATPPCLFASGTHRPMAVDEMRRVLGPAADRVRPVAHDCDAGDLVELGSAPGGGPIRVRPEVAEADALLVVGAMGFHYLAGFGGGRKMLLPGLVDRATATAVHRASVTDAPPGRASGIGPAGVLARNPLHRAILDRLGPFPPTVGVSVVLGGGRSIVDAEAGALLSHHERLAERFAAARTVAGPAVDRLLVSAGGAPWDSDLVQAHKALVAVAPWLMPGARVVVVAACAGGPGHPQLLEWATATRAREQLEALLTSFHISKQTAWSLRDLGERFEVGLLSELPRSDVAALGYRPLTDEEDAARFLGEGPVTVCPDGAALCYVS